MRSNVTHEWRPVDTVVSCGDCGLRWLIPFGDVPALVCPVCVVRDELMKERRIIHDARRARRESERVMLAIIEALPNSSRELLAKLSG